MPNWKEVKARLDGMAELYLNEWNLELGSLRWFFGKVSASDILEALHLITLCNG